MVTPIPTAVVSESTALPPEPIAPEFLRALAVGSVWAVVCIVSSGLDLGALAPLCIAAAWTQLLLLLATGAIAQSPALGARLALGAAVLGLGALFIGQVLQTHTHHRPLGAVIWVLLLAGLCVPVAALVQRVKPSSWLGYGALALASSVLVWHGRSSLEASVWIQGLAGLGCCAAAVLHRSRWPLAGAPYALPSAAVLLAGGCWVLWSGRGANLFDHAPFALGILGLF